ncbi:MAG: GIN domain-containing protein [Aestuariibaculum sp.]
MKKIYLSLFIFILTTAIYAQDLEKVKGNKVITRQETQIDDFHTIIIDNDFKVGLIQGQTASVDVETDENLHEYLDFNISKGVLTLSKTAKLSPKKSIVLKVSYSDNLTNIRVKDKAEAYSLTPIDLENITLIVEGSAEAKLTLKADHFTFQSNEKTKTELNITSKSATFTLSGNAKLDAHVYSDSTQIEQYDRSKISFEGKTNELTVLADNNAQFAGSKFLAQTCKTTNEASGDTFLNVSGNVVIDAAGSSSVYLYNNPKITIERFNDSAKIQKKE